MYINHPKMDWCHGNISKLTWKQTALVNAWHTSNSKCWDIISFIILMTVYWRQLLEYIWKKKEKEKEEWCWWCCMWFIHIWVKDDKYWKKRKLFRRSFQSMFMFFSQTIITFYCQDYHVSIWQKFNSLRLSGAYMRQYTNYHWFK